jgi:GTP-binding protein
MYSLTLSGTFYTLEQLAAFSQQTDETCEKITLQIAFAGRSNVGKSSLINALAGRKNLAKVSSTPGKTASINFYRVDSKQEGFQSFYLVDLPGYGYAQRSKTEREKWSYLIGAYLKSTEQLHALAVLLDCRLEPQQSDLELISYARTIRLPLLPLLTKADKCTRNEQAKRQSQWKKILYGQKPILTAAGGSAAQRLGIDELWQAMVEISQ